MPSTSAANPPGEKELQSVSKSFATAQTSASTHRRTIASLHKTFLACAAYKIEHNGQTRFAGEKLFMNKFRDCLYRVLPVKKGEQSAERVMKFVGGFAAFAFEASTGSGDEDTPISRLVYALLKNLLPGLEAANKAVRYRVTQAMEKLLCAPDMDEDLYAALLDALRLRLRDREAPVRVQAVLCLAKLSPDEPLAALEDAHPDVRKAVLYVTDQVDPLASRIRDVDINTRKMVCAKLATKQLDQIQDRHTRKQALSACKDREEAVRKVAGKMVAHWIGKDSLEEFLGHFDLLSQSEEAQTAVEAALRARPELAAEITFDDAYWLNLTPLRAFFARVICQFYATNATKLDEFLPVATSLAHYIKDAWFNLLSHDDEEVTEDQTFILDQLLQLAQMLDFTDEAGRRAMMDGFVDDERPNGVRNMLTDQAFPESLYGGAFDLLAKLVENDTDFMQIIVELVQDLRFEANVTAPEPQPDDSDEDSDLDVEESLKTPARRQVAPQRLEPTTLDVEHAALHIRCLLYIRNLLERVIAPIKENPMLRGLVHEVIVPAVRTKDEDIRKLGMHDLGLCCLLDREMATESFGLYANQSVEESVSPEMRVNVFRVIFDILLLYGTDFLEEKGYNEGVIIGFLERALEAEEAVQTVAAVGICKLMLSGIITDQTVLNKLVIVYFAPETADNQALRQCLSYYFPVYCYSSAENQKRMASILVDSLDILTSTYDSYPPDTMIPPAQIAGQLIEWTDPGKQVETVQNRDDSLHAMLALDFLKVIYSRKAKDERKRYCQLLAKLNLPHELDAYKLRNLVVLMQTISDERPLSDTVSKNALSRFETSLRKLYGNKIDAIDDFEVDAAEDVHAWIQEADAKDAEDAARAAQADEYQEAEQVRPKARRKTAPKKRAPTKRARSTSAAPTAASDDDDDNEQAHRAPRRSTRARSTKAPSANSRKVDKMLVEQGLEEDSEEEEEANRDNQQMDEDSESA